MKKRDAEIILIGSELLQGERRDAHLFFLAGKLKQIGVRLSGCTITADKLDEIADLVREKVMRAETLILCGGLGPTMDDLTRDAVARGLDKSLVIDKDAAREVEGFFERRGYEVTPEILRQVHFPEGAELIPNRFGTAPGFRIEHGGSQIFVLPGPPREMRPMVEDFVIPRLKKLFKRDELFTVTFRTAGIGESVLLARLAPLISQYDCFDFSSLPSIGMVDIVATEKIKAASSVNLEEQAKACGKELEDLLGINYYGKGADTLEGVAGRELARRKMTISIAESLTGGLLGKRLTDIPGSSSYFLADVVAYSNESKMSFLGVSAASLKKYGAVSEAVCREMTDGVREKTGSTWGLATTGIAGPSGGTEKKPLGLCFYGLSWDGGSLIKNSIFHGEREVIREKVVQASLLLLLEELEEG